MVVLSFYVLVFKIFCAVGALYVYVYVLIFLVKFR